MAPTVVIAAGGTAGHVVPALAVADALRASGADVSFLGTRDRLESRLVPEAGYEIDFLDVSGLDRGNPIRALGAAAKAARAVPAAKRVLRERGADVVMGGGGYVSGPAGLAAVRSGIPLVLTEADSHLGLANRLLARRASRVCLAFPLPGRDDERYLVTGRPVPAAVLEADREAARERFGIGPSERYLLVFGGSQGARSINETALAAFAEGDAERDFGVLHVTGHRDYAEAESRVREAAPERYTLIEYEPSLADTLAACDLVLARAGGSIFEIAAAGRPAILVPYPHAAADHQAANAEWMEQAGAAEVVADADLTPQTLIETTTSILSYPARIVEMSAASRSLARPDAAQRIADEILAGGAMSDWKGRELHFIAIGGAGMSGLALVAAELGAAVTGSDRAESSYVERLRRAGLEPRIGHDAESVPEGADVVVSTAIAEDNPELARARERGQRVMHRGELLAELCSLRRLIAVAGTHGKTTTAGMLVHALRETGADPAFVLGGELPGAGPGGEASNAGWGAGEWIVAEADESDASFLELRPEVAVVTNVELDHHSRWRSRAELLDAFARFAEPASGLALGAGSDLDALAEGRTALRFDADAPGPPLDLAVPGRHNVLNARAALAAVELAGLDLGPAAAALASFPGIVRRLERKGVRGGAVVYDDYAHHPTEVSAALAALRELGPQRLVAVFQPHLYSRTKALAGGFGRALAAADVIGVLDVYPAREEPVGELAGVSGLQVAEAAAESAGGRPVWWLQDAERAERVLTSQLREGDLVVTLGAGDIFALADALVDGASEG